MIFALVKLILRADRDGGLIQWAVIFVPQFNLPNVSIPNLKPGEFFVKQEIPLLSIISHLSTDFYKPINLLQLNIEFLQQYGFMFDYVDLLVEIAIVGLASIVDSLYDFLNGGYSFLLAVL